MSAGVDRLVRYARALADAVMRDDCGQLVGGIWMGGNGGLLSLTTISAAQDLRQAIEEYERDEAARRRVEGEKS